MLGISGTQRIAVFRRGNTRHAAEPATEVELGKSKVFRHIGGFNGRFQLCGGTGNAELIDEVTDGNALALFENLCTVNRMQTDLIGKILELYTLSVMLQNVTLHKWTELLNEIQPDLTVYGHQHDLYPFLEDQETMYNDAGKLIYNSQFMGTVGKTYGGYLTDYDFNGFIAGRRGTAQLDDVSALNRKDHVGLAVYADLSKGTQVCQYINTAGEVVPVYNPFAEGPAQEEFLLDLK